MMSSLSGAGNGGSDLEICTANINDAQQLNLMEEGNGSQNNASDAIAGAHANMVAAVSSTDPPLSDSQTIATVTDIAAHHDQMVKELKRISANVSLLEPPLPDTMIAAAVHQTFDKEEGDESEMNLAGLRMTSDNSGEITSALMPPMSDAETIVAVIDIDAQCDQMDEEIKGIAKRASSMEPPLPDNTTAATIDQRIDEEMGTDDEEMGTDLAGLDMTSASSDQVNLKGGEHVLDDEGSEIANTAVGQTTPRDQTQGQGRMQGNITTEPPSPPTPLAAGRVEHVSDGATQGPSAESATRALSVVTLDPSVPMLEARLVDDEILTAQVHPTSVYDATRIPDRLPVPWWKRHQKYLIGVSAAILLALGVALGQVLSPDDPPSVLPPSDSNSTLPSASNSAYYPDRIKKLCSNDASGRGNSSDQILFETAESCCEEMLWDYEDECLVNSLGTSHRPSSPPSDSPTISDVPSSTPSEAPSSSNAPSPVPSQSPSESMSPTLSASPTHQPSLSMRPTTQLQSSALRLVTSEDVVGAHISSENVAVQGDAAVIGAPYNGNKRGAAFVLNRDESGWSQLAKLEAPDGEVGDLFGESVAIDGDTIVVGAPALHSRKGSVHVFAKLNGSWQHQARLVAPDRDADDDDDSFGYSVDIHQDRIVVGARWEDSIGVDAGAAYVFVRNETTWALESNLLAPAGDAFDNFGVSVGIFDDAIVVGATSEDASAANSGAAHVYSRTSGGAWEHRARLSSPDGASWDEFGRNVGIHGNRVIVGAPADDSDGFGAGASFVFADDGSAWTLQAKLLAPDGATGDGFGRGVGIFEGTAVVGSASDDDDGEYSGSVHVYELAKGAWSHRAKVLAPDGAGNFFGLSVAIHNGTVIAHSMSSGKTFAFSE